MSEQAAVTVSVDNSELIRTLSRLTELTQRLHQVVNGLVRFSQPGSKLARFVMSHDGAGGTGNVRARLKPSDRLLKLVAALNACEREVLVAEELTHQPV